MSDVMRHMRAMDSAAASLSKLAVPDPSAAMALYWREQQRVEDMIERAAIPYRTLTDRMASMSSLLEATRFTVPTIDFAHLGGLIGEATAQRQTLAHLTNELLVEHTRLIESLAQPDILSDPLPLAVAELPILDVYVHTSAVRSVTPHEPLAGEEQEHATNLHGSIITQTESFLEDTLPELKPVFLEQYHGIKARIRDRGPDWWTQGGASMRKLVKGVLHSVAPNERVLTWATANNRPLDSQSRPTRATKIEWLCRFTSNETYRTFVRTDLESALALIAMLDVSQHRDEFPEFAGDFHWILLRAEVAIRHMLVLWKLADTNQRVK